MTQEQKQLLLQDLCARLPYGVKLELHGEICTVFGIVDDYVQCTAGVPTDQQSMITNVKPYLRPMSSMTVEEKADLEAYSKQELDKYTDSVFNHADEDIIRSSQIALIYKDIDWYNAHHIDYRGLIPMGLGIDCTGLNIY